MSRKADREGLSWGYRFLYRVKYIGLWVYGPPQLSGNADPHVRMKRQRDAKVAAARSARLQRESTTGE